MLAVVIPYYKKEFFQETLDCLIKQTNHNFSVYIGDDFSPSSFESKINDTQFPFKLKYKRYSNNLGRTSLVQHWDRCLKMINDEEWFMILGDDDVLQDNFVEEFYENLADIKKESINVVRFASVKTDIKGKPIIDTVESPRMEETSSFLEKRIKGLTRSSLSEFVFRTESYIKYGFKDYPLAWHTDVMAILEFSEFKNIYGINTSVVKVRSSGINISSMTNNLVQKNLASFSFFYDLLNNHDVHFSTVQLEYIYHKLEKTFLDNKKNISFWFRLVALYVKRMKIIRLLNFVKKYFIAIIKIKK